MFRMWGKIFHENHMLKGRWSMKILKRIFIDGLSGMAIGLFAT